jgi:hypothetical protein
MDTLVGGSSSKSTKSLLLGPFIGKPKALAFAHNHIMP